MQHYASLNPYSIGIWSATVRLNEDKGKYTAVLILILLEYGLRPRLTARYTEELAVLILILLEYGLRPQFLMVVRCLT